MFSNLMPDLPNTMAREGLPLTEAEDSEGVGVGEGVSGLWMSLEDLFSLGNLVCTFQN